MIFNPIEMQKNIFDNEQIWKWVESNSDNYLRYDFTVGFTPEEVRSVADIGCGNGIFLKRLNQQRKISRSVAVDNSDGALASVPFEKYKASITAIPLPDASVDCTYALEVLEHLPPEDFRTALKELARVSKEYIIISVPYREDLEWNKAICPHCSEKFHPDGHLQSFDERKIRHLFDGEGYENIRYSRLGWSKRPILHKTYIRLAYPQQMHKNPHFTICPNCNAELQPAVSVHMANETAGKKSSGGLRQFVRSVWPKENKSYWIIGLYKKK